jgi:WD40 repeat protein
MCPTIVPGSKVLAGWTFREARVTLCDLPSGQILATWRAHPTKIEGLAVSADGRFLATFGDEPVVRVWSTADQSEVARLLGHRGPVYAAVFTPDGSRLITGGNEDFSVRVWDLPVLFRTAK